uniref:NADH-ubiquinone oxidoreductase chain 5 n=1 Tax=Paraglypturus tonganus (nomen nudum) TaxID=1519029 RepID=A0A0U1WNA5_9EUCA|nr:NADH dehydrogenase subunit 5 [Paraglypturus tonganus (nomen nudum)]AIG22694.1 NADH dehydrogenase subunit 5 [Paraglypturus tonganus (nomen nudum)]
MIWKIYMNFSSMVFLMIISILSFTYSIYLIFSNSTTIIEWEFIPLNSSMIEFTIIFDWISLMFLSLVCLISAMVLFYSGEYMKNDKNMNRFMYLVIAFVFSMSMMICSPNLISILLGWDGLGLVSYILVIFYQNEKSANAGMLTILSNRIGDVAILMSIGLMFTLGNWNFMLYAPLITDDNILIKSLVILAAMTKSAQMPFSAWLPAAMAAPTPVSALVHSSTLVTAGVYLLIRFSPALEASKTQSFLLLISALTMFMAGVSANFEYDLKKIIALSTLSQLGVMISILALGFPLLAFFHLLTHALFKALLFLCAGVIIHNAKDYQDIRMMGSIPGFMPLTTMYMNIANLALCGAPFLAGFYSKDLILEVAFMSNINIIAFSLYVMATGLTVSYTLRLIFLSLTTLFNTGSLSNMTDETKTMTNPMMSLTLGALMSGSLLSWLVFPNPHLICLPFLFKTLPITVTIIGALMGYLLNILKTNHNMKSLALYPVKVFSSSMWFMPLLSTLPASLTPLKISSILQKAMDKGWSESLGSQGIYRNSMSMSLKIQTMQENSIKLVMSSFFIWLIIIMFVMI